MDDTSRKEWLETTNWIMKDKRILVKRWEVTHPDTLVGSRIKSIPIYTVGCRFPYEE